MYAENLVCCANGNIGQVHYHVIKVHVFDI